MKHPRQLPRPTKASKMDSTATYPPQELPPIYPVVELYTAQEMSPQVADVSRFEPYSIGAAIHQMFAEAEQGIGQPEMWERTYEQEYPSDTEAFRTYMQEVHRELKESSAVQELRQAVEGGHEITKDMVQAVFRAYERVVSTATKKLRNELSPGQLTQLKKAGRNNLDWSYRGLLVERLTQEEGAPVKYSLEDFFLVLNPKARKVQYMERQEILKTLSNSMTRGSVTKEQLKHDVDLARQFAHKDMAGETVTDDDLKPLETNFT